MRIKAKLAIGFSLLLLLLIGIASFNYQRLSMMNHSIDHFYENRFEKVRLALAVRAEVNAAARVMNDMIFGDEVPSDAVKDITAHLTSAGIQFKKISTLELDDSEQVEMADITQTSNIYVTDLKKFMALIEHNQIAESHELYNSSLRDEQRKVIDSMDSLVKLQEDSLRLEMKDVNGLYDRSVRIAAFLVVFGLLLGTGIVFWVFPSITKGLNLLEGMADRFSKGRLRSFSRINIRSKDELGELAQLFKRIALDIQSNNEKEAMLSEVQLRQARMNAQIARVTELVHAGSDAKAAAQLFISEFAPVLGAKYGVIYLRDPLAASNQLELSGAYALSGEARESDKAAPATIKPGEGLVGQSYKDGRTIILSDVPDGYVKVGSALGDTAAKSLIVQPITTDLGTVGVVELASIAGFESESRELLVLLCDKLGTILNNIFSRRRVEELLRESQAMTEELQAQSEEMACQQEELRDANDKLESRQSELKKSELRLQQQQDELEHTNQELTVKTFDLEQHVHRVELQNRQIAQVNSELEKQALQLELASKYKSEFLANMSHELRTPLNSLLILSEFLTENREGNLTEKQREYMRTIHLSGNDLLKMIDEILDLSKVDAGKMDIHPEWIVLDDVSTFLSSQFGPMADSKNVAIVFERTDDVPQSVWTDGHRVKQIMRNLLSNAIKFTEAGEVSVQVRQPTDAEMGSNRKQPGIEYVALSVSDTGIGIPAEKRELIFEAFRQADGTTSRKYGGTGLGLTISRELAYLLEGWIHLEESTGGGSTFTLIIPERLSEDRVSERDRTEAEYSSEDLVAVASESTAGELVKSDSANQSIPSMESAKLEDDRDILTEEDDFHFAKVLIDMARSRGFKVIGALRGDEGKRKLLNKLSRGRSTFDNKRILLADDDVRNVFALSSVLEHRNMQVVYAENGIDALRRLEEDPGIDLILMDIMMPEMDGYEAIRRIRRHPEWSKLPVIALTAKVMKEDRNKCIEAGASDYISKPVNTEQLLSLMRAWLHR